MKYNLPLKLISFHISAILIIALASLAGWHFDIDFFKHPVEGTVAMNPLTAIGFIVASICFFLLYHTPGKEYAKPLALVVALIGILRIFSLVPGLNFRPDTLIYARQINNDIVNGMPNTMAPNTAINFILMGMALFLVMFKDKRLINAGHALSLATLFISLLSIIGYIYDVNTFYGVANYIPMALNSAICFFLLSLSVLFIRSNEGFMVHITSSNEGSKIAQVLLPAAILVPVILGVFRLDGESRGLYTTQYGTALYTVANIMIFILFTWWSASAINRSALVAKGEILQRKQSEESLELTVQERTSELKKSEKHFKALIENSGDVISLLDVNAKTIYVTKAIKKITGFTIEERSQHDATEIIFPDDLETAQNVFAKAIASPGVPVPYTFRLQHKNGHPVWVEGFLTNLLHDENVGAVISNYHDISEKKKAEEEAAHLKEIKQKEITKAVITAQESERSNIGRELHDNVNQLLGTIRLYIGMAKKGGQNIDSLLTDASGFTLTAIEEIRKLSKTLITPSIRQIGLQDAVKDLAEEIMKVYPIKIIISPGEFIEQGLHDKFKVNLFRIIQEQINNILKHAHASTITINMEENNEKMFVSISDNGLGFDTSQKRFGIGIINIKSRCELYNGSMELVSAEGSGTTLRLDFNKMDIVNADV